MGADSAEADCFTTLGSRLGSPRLSDTTAVSGAEPMFGVTPKSVWARREMAARRGELRRRAHEKSPTRRCVLSLNYLMGRRLLLAEKIHRVLRNPA